MLQQVRCVGLCFVLAGLLLGPAKALGQNYVTEYSEDFAYDPGWTTNNSSRYYWRSSEQTYQVTMFDNTNEYGTIGVPYGGGSFRLQFDIYIDAMNWAGNINVGIYDASRQAYVTVPGTQFVTIDFGIGDLGRGIQLLAEDKNGIRYFVHAYPTSSWGFNTWYTGIITYDALSGTIEWELRDPNTGLLLNTLAVSGVSGFSALENLGASKVGDFYAPSAYGSGQIDNVTFSEAGPCDSCQTPTCDAGGPYASECEGTTTDVSLDGSLSSDPDGDPLGFMWSTDCPGGFFDDPASVIPTLTVDTSSACDVRCNATLSVDDGNGGTSQCSTAVTIEDTTPPVVTCSAVPLDHHLVAIEYSVEDACGDATGSAVIDTLCCPLPVTDGQIVKVECKKHDTCELKLDFEDDVFELKSDQASLVVNAIDECGNQATCTVDLCVPGDDEGDNGKEDDDG